MSKIGSHIIRDARENYNTLIGKTQFNSFVDGLHKQGAITKQQMAVLKDGTVTDADKKIADSLVQKGKIYEGFALMGGLDTAARESKPPCVPPRRHRDHESPRGTAFFEHHLDTRIGYAVQGAAHSVVNFRDWMHKEMGKIHHAGIKAGSTLP